MSGNEFRGLIERVMAEYYEARTSQEFAKNPLGEVIRRTLPELIKKFDFIDGERFIVEGSCGKGGWASVPWIAIMNKTITTTTQEGVYVVYLFSKDMKTLYLTLNQGCMKLKKTYGNNCAEILQNVADNVRKVINSEGFNADNKLKIGNELYEKGCIFYKEYKDKQIPDDEELKRHLKDMMRIYDKYFNVFYNNGDKSMIRDESINKFEYQDCKNKVGIIANYIKSQGFQYEDNLIKNFYLCLKTKPFVILAGTSGTGKSKLVKLFAEALGATSENGRFKLVPVRPDWSDATDLLGYRDLHGKFHPGILANFIKSAIEDKTKPYFFCLDEMNLARVEYYFSDILSIMETRKRKNNEIITDKILQKEIFGDDENAYNEYKDIYIPENLYIIGTVNMDETTFPFSKKVLDRANTIEFSYVDLDFFNETELDTINEIDITNDFLKSDFVLLNECSNHEEFIKEVLSVLKEINEVLRNVNLNFGYRIRDEICFYMLYNHMYNLMGFNEALDYQILQKILPRIQGSSMSIKRVLIDLYKICRNNKSNDLNYDEVEVSNKMFDELNRGQNIPYKKSAYKIASMVRRFEEDGFTSYWM